MERAVFVSSPCETHVQVTVVVKASFLTVLSFSALLVLGSYNFDSLSVSSSTSMRLLLTYFNAFKLKPYEKNSYLSRVLDTKTNTISVKS
jgi:hypothetical protein